MARPSNSRLQVWAKNLINDEECLEEVRVRFQLRMLDRFRAANADQRDMINAIMDNEAAFFEELTAICDEIGEINATEDEEPEN